MAGGNGGGVLRPMLGRVKSLRRGTQKNKDIPDNIPFSSGIQKNNPG
jgi:hypothetical protein